MPDVELRRFRPERDTALVAGWLSRTHVARWWGDPAHALAALAKHPAGTAALIVADTRPVGYLCWQSPTRAELAEAGLADLPADLVDIDILIGEPDGVGRGIGPEALRQLLGRLRGEGVRVVGMAAAVANARALRAYAKVGFRPYRDFVELGEHYRYLTCDLGDAPPGRLTPQGVELNDAAPD